MTDKANLEKELEELHIAKQDVAEEIKIARGHGDLSENAEYTEAKNNEARIYGRLAEVEELLKTATFVDDSKLSTDVVNVGTVVRVYDMEYEEEDTYTIVGFTESDPMKLFISARIPHRPGAGGRARGRRGGSQHPRRHFEAEGSGNQAALTRRSNPYGKQAHGSFRTESDSPGQADGPAAGQAKTLTPLPPMTAPIIPARSRRTSPNADGKEVSIAGRMMSRRVMGKASFAHLQDRDGRIQIYVRQDGRGRGSLHTPSRKTDIGDIIGVKGVVFRTEDGRDLSVHAQEITLLTKCLHPLPEKFHGLQGHRHPLSPALSRPDRQPRGAGYLRQAQP